MKRAPARTRQVRGVLPAFVLVLLVAGCMGTPPAPPAATPPTGASPAPTPSTPGVSTPGLSTPPATPTPTPGPGGDAEPRFDGERALDLVKEQVRRPDGTLRHRIPNTEGNNETARWISDRLREAGFEVAWHHFNATYGCAATPMHNVVGERAGTSNRTVVFAAHYDTRPVADKDPDPANRSLPIPGANDGASGVAVLLELARVLPRTHNDTYRFVFFDGEDGGGYKGGQCTDWILGSRAYARDLPKEDLAAIRAFVLVDMIGDPHLQLPREGHSRTGPGRGVLDAVYDVARTLGHPQFLDRDGPPITDDHFPFVQAGVPAIDLIHLVPGSPRVFPEWHHTMADDVDQVSAGSLAAVGETLEAWARAGAPVRNRG